MGLFKKPKAPKPTANDRELERRQRSEADDLINEKNQRLKAIKRGRRGRSTLIGSGSERGIERGGVGGAGVRGGGGGVKSGGAARVSGGILSSGGGRAGSGGVGFNFSGDNVRRR